MSRYLPKPLFLALLAAFATGTAHASFYISDSAPRLYDTRPENGPVDPRKQSFTPILKIEPGIRSAVYPYAVSNSRAAPPGNMPKNWKNGEFFPGMAMRLQILVPPGVSAIDLGTTMTTNFGAYSGTSGANLHLCPGFPATADCPVYYVPGGGDGYVDFEDQTRFGRGTAGSLAGRIFPNADVKGVSTQPRWFNFYYHLSASRGEGMWLDSLQLTMLIEDVPSYNRWLAARPWSGHSELGVAKEASCDGVQADWVMPCDGPASWPGAPKTSQPAVLPLGHIDDAEPGSAADSGEWLQAGEGGPWEISVVNGFYQLNGSQFTAEDGQINAGDRVRVRAFAADTPGASKSAFLRVGPTQSRFDVRTVAAEAATGLAALNGGDGVLFAGRRDGVLNERIRLQERRAGVIKGALDWSIAGSTVKFAAASKVTAVADGEALPSPRAIEVGSTPVSAVRMPLPADPGDKRGGFLLLGGETFLRFDTSAARDGDVVTLELGQPYGGRVQIARVVDATRYGEIAQGKRVKLTAGAPAMALPALTIQEAAGKALDTSGNRVIGAKLPAGVSFDPTARPSVTVTDLRGRRVVDVATVAAEGDSLRVTLGRSWNLASAGPHKLVVDGLKVQAASSIASGPLTLTVGGAATTEGNLREEDLGADLGARASLQKLTFGEIASLGAPWQVTPETVTVADPAAAVIKDVSLAVAEQDRGRSGALFVAALAGDKLFFLTSSGWQSFAACGGACDLSYLRPAALDRHVLDPLPTALDLRALSPLQLLVGYGVGATAQEGFNRMLGDATYRIIYRR